MKFYKICNIIRLLKKKKKIYYNSHLSELRTGGRDYGAGLFNETTKNVNPDFCFKPLICLNQSVGPNKWSGFSKTGAITIRIRLNRNVNVLYGEGNTNARGYNVSNLWKVTVKNLFKWEHIYS